MLAWSTTIRCRSCITSTSCACITCSASAGPRSPPGSAAARCCATSSASRRRRRRSPSPSRSARPSGCRHWRCVEPTQRCAASRRHSSAARPSWPQLRERGGVAAVLLEGEAGVGKTRLAQEVLRAGSTVAVRCEAIASEAPLHAVTEALRALLEAPERLARLDSLGADDRREVARLLPALAAGREPHSRSHRPDGATDAAPTAAQEETASPTALASMAARQRFLDALGEALDRLAGPGGCVWIDDAQWADESTLALIAHLANRRARDPTRHVALLVAARPLETSAAVAARDAMRRLERSGLVLRVPLAPFGADDTLQLVRELSGSGRGERFAARLQESTHGNPYFLLETLRYLFDAGELRIDAEGRWETAYDDAATYGRLPVPPTVREAVIERVERLGAPSRRVLEIAALAGDGFTLDLLRPASALDEWQAVEGLELSLQAGFVSGSVQGYRFSHELVRDAIAGQLSEERRRMIHHRLADALIERRGAPVRIATHLERAGLGATAVPWRIAAAAAERRLYAWREALDQLDAAAAHATELADRRDVARQRIELARLLYDVAAMEAAIDSLAEVAASADDEAAAIEALVWRAECAQMRKRPLEAALPAETAIARAGFAAAPPELRLRSHLALAHARFANGRLGDADGALADAAALAEAEGDALAPPLRALLLRGLANAARLRQDPARAEPLLREAARLLDGDAHLETRLQTLNLLAHVQHMGGRGDAAIAILEGCLADAERAGLTVVLRAVLPNLVTLCADAGQAERGRAFLERGVAALRLVDDDATRAVLQSRLAELSLTAGDLGAVWRASGESIGHYEANGGGSADYAPWCMRWAILVAAGEDDAAEAIYRELPQSPAWSETPASRAIRALKMEVAHLGRDPSGAAERLLGVARAAGRRLRGERGRSLARDGPRRGRPRQRGGSGRGSGAAARPRPLSAPCVARRAATAHRRRLRRRSSRRPSWLPKRCSPRRILCLRSSWARRSPRPVAAPATRPRPTRPGASARSAPRRWRRRWRRSSRASRPRSPAAGRRRPPGADAEPRPLARRSPARPACVSRPESATPLQRPRGHPAGVAEHASETVPAILRFELEVRTASAVDTWRATLRRVPDGEPIAFDSPLALLRHIARQTVGESPGGLQ